MHAQRGRPRAEHGFSLIELMVVVLVIAILIAIVVPTFFSARDRAENRAAETTLRHALIAAKTIYSDSNGFAGADESATGLITVEPGLQYMAHDTNSTGPKIVSVRASSGAWSAAVRSQSGDCYWIKELANGATSFGGDRNAPSTCTGDDADGAVSPAFP